jgi:hypothetical protein
VGKRSGEGFVAHRALLTNALERAIAERVTVNNVTLGRKGLLGYLKALGGSNIVKVIPSNGGASGSQAAVKRLKVICGANVSLLSDGEWISDKTPLSFSDVRVSPSNTVRPNIGATELSEALARVLPFTSKEDTRPVLNCVSFEAKEGKLTLVSADGFRLAIVSLDCDDLEGKALIGRDDLKGVVAALRKAKRARVSFTKRGDKLTGNDLVIDTELIRYKLLSYDGDYPDWPKLIPADFNTYAHLDTVEASKAVSSLKALSSGKDYPVDLTIGSGKLIMANPDDKGQTEVSADTTGDKVKVRLQGQYLAQAFRAFGGMVDFKLTNGYSPVLFSYNGYKLVVMPMMTDEANAQAKKDREAKAQAEAKAAKDKPKAAEPKAEKPKVKPKTRAKEPVKA